MAKNPQKLIQGRYNVVPRTLILIRENKMVLLQKGSATKKIWAGLYNGLGGHVERGEDLLTSAKRELCEEAGITCDDLKMVGSVMIDVDGTQGILMCVFSGKRPTGEIRASEEGPVEWVEEENVSSLPVVEDIPLILNLLKEQAEGQLFFGHYSYDVSGKLEANFSLQE